MATKIQTRSIDDLIVDESIDPRSQGRSEERIQQYAENIERLPPILIDPHNRILDGIHRYEAHKLAGKDTIRVEIVKPKTELDARIHAIKQNAIHGLALTPTDLKRNAVELYNLGAKNDAIAKAISRSVSTVITYVKEAREEWTANAIDIAGELTELGMSQQAIAEEIEEITGRSIDQTTVGKYAKLYQKQHSPPEDEAEDDAQESVADETPHTDEINRRISESESELTPEPEPQEAAEEEADVDEDDEEKDEESKRISVEMQYKLLKLGHTLELSIWVATNDRNKSHEGIKLGELPGMLLGLPNDIRANVPQSVERIDVLWLNDDDEIVAAFEVEHSTTINSGLLRMSDMLIAMNGTQIRTYIVAPDDRLYEAKSKINSPTFKKTGLAEYCRFISYTELTKKYNELEHNGSISYDWQGLLDEIGHKL